MICTFFGHRDTPAAVRPLLSKTLRELIVLDGVSDFLVGHQGGFDRMVLSELKKMQGEFPHIRFAVVLSDLSYGAEVHADTVYPEGMETVPKRFAIARRNEWMLKQADMVVSYVTHSTGGAAQYTEKAEKRGKWVIRVAEKS